MKAFRLICCLLLASGCWNRSSAGFAGRGRSRPAVCFSEVSVRFQKETGLAVKLTFGSSGNFFFADSERRAL